ncbi:hypothetical protein SAMN00120144_3795 [Hymenobacter roseosalivarius DSM 11622]|uniref:Uncharacterized protein n=1 Tax=Hymenobacter roseosalivarius DSM 11622 TaxID=645990 RepID=A0A1W1UGX0_9BACT|nr:hypothetical protein [Hymenobacter roseosalivarius]SMB80272.1 hypothetical protein SAMN00120144_3795 [Hymenobacter roseosalivarius DSM 11622]
MPPRSIRHFTKPTIDFTQQLQKLQARGLVVADQSRPLRYLANISYTGSVATSAASWCFTSRFQG